MQTLYRHFDKSGNLLYVGISKDPIRRMSQHNTTAKWYSLIATITHEIFPTRKEVLIAEKDAIKKEQPLYNIQHKLHKLPEGDLAIYYYHNDAIGSDEYFTTATNVQDAVENLIECINTYDMYHILQFKCCPEIEEEYKEYAGLVRYKVSGEILDSTLKEQKRILDEYEVHKAGKIIEYFKANDLITKTR